MTGPEDEYPSAADDVDERLRRMLHARTESVLPDLSGPALRARAGTPTTGRLAVSGGRRGVAVLVSAAAVAAVAVGVVAVIGGRDSDAPRPVVPAGTHAPAPRTSPSAPTTGLTSVPAPSSTPGSRSAGNPTAVATPSSALPTTSVPARTATLGPAPRVPASPSATSGP